MFNKIKEWFTANALGKASAVVAKAAASLALAHAGVLQQWGITATIDPNVLSLGILGVLSWVWHKVLGQAEAK